MTSSPHCGSLHSSHTTDTRVCVCRDIIQSLERMRYNIDNLGDIDNQNKADRKKLILSKQNLEEEKENP